MTFSHDTESWLGSHSKGAQAKNRETIPADDLRSELFPYSLHHDRYKYHLSHPQYKTRYNAHKTRFSTLETNKLQLILALLLLFIFPQLQFLQDEIPSQPGRYFPLHRRNDDGPRIRSSIECAPKPSVIDLHHLRQSHRRPRQ